MLAEKIKQCRKAAGLTQTELAGALDVAQNTISQYESGKRTPTVKKLLALSMLLGCSVDELAGSRAVSAVAAPTPEAGQAQ
ncbi:MAG: helix-turn-helix transcriptional regulator [Lawsonibacter sp.]